MKFGALTMLGATALLTTQLEAQRHHRYTLVDLGTFGGSGSYVEPLGNGGPLISPTGAVVGQAETSIPVLTTTNGFCNPGTNIFRALGWLRGVVTDLGTLPGGNCSNTQGVNASGDIVGNSENSITDPLLGLTELRAVLWKDAKIMNLGTFGGNHSAAFGINNQDEVVGFALNAVPDPFSLFELQILGSSNGTQTRAFLWQNEQFGRHDDNGEAANHLQDLGTLGGPDAWAVYVNERGEVAGFSYTNSTPNPITKFPTQDPFLWRNGRMIDLGTLGGTFGLPTGLNNRGQVIGQSNLTGDQNGSHPFLWDDGRLIDLFTSTIGGNPITANALTEAGEIVGGAAFPNHPFDAYLWRNGRATDLGAVAGDCISQAMAINSKDQIVGNSLSCDGSTLHSFLWEKGSMVDLNTLIPPNSGLQLVEPLAINDRGEIAGDGVPPGCSGPVFGTCQHAFVLVPCDEERSNEQGCQDAGEVTMDAIPSNSMNQNPPTMTNTGLSPGDIVARMRARFRRKQDVSGWPPK